MQERKKLILIKEAMRQAHHGLWAHRAVSGCAVAVLVFAATGATKAWVIALFTLVLLQSTCLVFLRWEADALREIALDQDLSTSQNTE